MTKRVADMTPDEVEAVRAKRRQYRNTARLKDPEGFALKAAAAHVKYRAEHHDRYRASVSKQRKARLRAGTEEEVKARREKHSAAALRRVHELCEIDAAAYWSPIFVVRKKRRDHLLVVDPNRVHLKGLRGTRRRTPLADSTAKKLAALLDKALPRTMHWEARAEIMQRVYMAVVEGSLHFRDAANTVEKYKALHYREYGTIKNLSLDVVNPDTGKAWIDNLDSETRHF